MPVWVMCPVEAVPNVEVRDQKAGVLQVLRREMRLCASSLSHMV